MSIADWSDGTIALEWQHDTLNRCLSGVGEYLSSIPYSYAELYQDNNYLYTEDYLHVLATLRVSEGVVTDMLDVTEKMLSIIR